MFDFIENDLQKMDPLQLKLYQQYQSNIRMFLATDRQSLQANRSKGRTAKSTTKRIENPVVIPADSEEDEDSDEGVSSFEATPAFKKQQ